MELEEHLQTMPYVPSTLHLPHWQPFHHESNAIQQQRFHTSHQYMGFHLKTEIECQRT